VEGSDASLFDVLLMDEEAKELVGKINRLGPFIGIELRGGDAWMIR